MKNLYLKSLYLSLSLLIFSGCSSEKFPSSENYDSKIKLSELNIDIEDQVVSFGEVKASKTMKILLENNSETPFALSLSLDGPKFILQRTDCGATLGAGKSCSVSVIANARGTFQGDLLSGSLLLGEERSIALSGTSNTGKVDPTSETGIPNLEISGDYPSIANPISNLYVKNVGDGNATVEGLSIDPAYTVRLNHCSGITLSPNKECRIQVMLNREKRTGSTEAINLSLNYKDNSGEEKVLATAYIPFIFVVKSVDSGEEDGTGKIDLNIKGVETDPLVLKINGELTETVTFETPYIGEEFEIQVLSKFERKILSESISGNRNLVDVKQFGNIPFPQNSTHFFYHEELITTFMATDAPNLKNVTNISSMFSLSTNFNHDIGNWDTSNVTNMNAVFTSAYSFNQNIGEWDTSKVTNMSNMFSSASIFNNGCEVVETECSNPLSWNTSNVTDMNYMFWGATIFNQNIGDWDTSKVSNMSNMFNYAYNFNKDLSGWCIPEVSTSPDEFDSNTYSWSLPKPEFGPDSAACLAQP